MKVRSDVPASSAQNDCLRALHRVILACGGTLMDRIVQLPFPRSPRRQHAQAALSNLQIMSQAAPHEAQRTASALTAALFDKLTQQAEDLHRCPQLIRLGVCELVIALSQAHLHSAAVQSHAMLLMDRLARSDDGSSALDAAGACKAAIDAMCFHQHDTSVTRYGMSFIMTLGARHFPVSDASLLGGDAVEAVTAAFGANMYDAAFTVSAVTVMSALCGRNDSHAWARAANFCGMIVAVQQQACSAPDLNA